MRFVLLAIFIGMPILEIAVFLKVGSFLGAFETIACILLTAVIGLFFVRQQGFKVLEEVRQAQANDEMPVKQVFHGFLLLIAGFFLITPGFITDGIRVFIAGAARQNTNYRLAKGFFKTTVVTDFKDADPMRPDNQSGKVIEGKAVEITDQKPDR